jgi:hypothetical protein
MWLTYSVGDLDFAANPGKAKAAVQLEQVGIAALVGLVKLLGQEAALEHVQVAAVQR